MKQASSRGWRDFTLALHIQPVGQTQPANPRPIFPGAFSFFLNFGKRDINIVLTILTPLRVHVSGTEYIHYIVNYRYLHPKLRPQTKLGTPQTITPLPQPLVTSTLFLGICLLLVLFIRGIAHYLSFYARLISLSIMSSRPTYVAAHFKLSFLFMAEYCSGVGLARSSSDGHLGCFHLLATVNDGVQICIFINQILLEQGHAHLFIYHLWLLSCYKDTRSWSVPTKTAGPTNAEILLSSPFTGKVC